MVFSSTIFLVFFLPIFLAIYFLLPNTKVKNIYLLVASIIFYSWGAPKFIFAILLTTALDFYFVRLLDKAEDKEIRRFFLLASLGLNLGLLFYFKYCNFFIDNANRVLEKLNIGKVEWLDVILPIGISFYTFESLTYVIDVYRKKHKPLTNFWEYQLYIILFPKLIAGPIIRYHEISDQINDRSERETVDDRLAGFIRFCLGLGKKVLIANVMAEKADEIFALPVEQLTPTLAWVGMLAYTFQIYFDFSGYSDMAIGIGRMIGFKFPENFNNPYTAKSVTEFWQRWHMTLGSWMKNYLYIPLGGNKVETKWRLFFNLWFVFLASGFWHGAAWTFIAWGVYHGFFLVIERAFLSKVLDKLGKWISIVYTFGAVAVGWVFFRADSIRQALRFCKRIIRLDQLQLSSIVLSKEFVLIFCIAVLFSFFAIIKPGEKLQNYFYATKHSFKSFALLCSIALLLFILSLSDITASGFNPFIYFRF